MKLLLKKRQQPNLLLSKMLRYSLLAFIILAFLLLGFVRDGYILNLSDATAPLLISRYDNSLAVNVLEASAQSSTDPRWYTLPIYLFLYTGLTTGALWLLFRKHEVLLITAIGYGILVLLAGGLLLASKSGFSPAVTFTMAQQLKELMLSPFMALLLLAFCYGSRGNEDIV